MRVRFNIFTVHLTKDIAYASKLMNHSVVRRYSPTTSLSDYSLAATYLPSSFSWGSCTSLIGLFPLLEEATPPQATGTIHKNGQTPIRRSASVSLA